MTAVALQYRTEILSDLESGQYLKDISSKLGVSHSAISQVLASDKEYIKARETGMQIRLETYQEQLDGAEDVLTLARAREGFKAQSWRCEREFPERWGGKPTIVINQGISMDQALDAAAAQLLDRMRVVSGEVVDKSEDK